MAAEFGELALRLEYLIDQRWLPPAVEPILGEIDRIFARHDKQPDDPFWGQDALDTHGDWNRIRELARQFLAAI